MAISMTPSSSPTTTQSSSPTVTRRDWSQLPADLIHNIASHLPHLSDLIRFSSVCSSWRSSVSASSSPKLPWLHHPPSLFRSLFESKSYSFSSSSAAAAAEVRLFPLYDGWIASLSPQIGYERSVSLRNPISGASLTLPPLRLPRRALRSPETFRFLRSGNLLAVLCPDGPGIAFCFPGLADDRWQTLDVSACFPQGNFAYRDGKFFVFNKKTKVTWVFDVATGEKVGDVKVEGVDCRKSCDHYLVMAREGKELLLVLRNDRIDLRMFEVFRLVEEGSRMRWVEAEGLEDGVLFLDSLHGMWIEVSRFGGWKGNCIYFVDYNGGNGWEEGDDWVEDDCGVKVYDIGKDQVEQVAVCSSGYSAMEWRRAMWVVPSLVGSR